MKQIKLIILKLIFFLIFFNQSSFSKGLPPGTGVGDLPVNILILLVCWSVFWIHPKEIESRLTITIVCLLSLIAYNFVIDEDLPKLSYLTIIDYIILLSYVFATIPNFLTIASFEFHRTNNKNWQILDKNSKFYGPVIYVGLVVIIILFNSTNNPYTSSFLRIFSQVE